MSEYAIYNNRWFRAVYNDGKVFLTSKKEEGFELHSFISGFETINTYEKTVSEKEVDAVFDEEIFIRYLLNDYCLFYSPRYEDFIKDNSIRILTTNSELAHTYNFNRSEPGVKLYVCANSEFVVKILIELSFIKSSYLGEKIL